MLERKKRKDEKYKKSNCKIYMSYMYIICALIFLFYGYIVEIRIGNWAEVQNRKVV